MRSPHNANLRLHRHASSALITTCCANREPLFASSECATIVMDAMRWLDAQRRIILFAAVVMPDHLHFVADPLGTQWARHIHVLKSHVGRSINRYLNRSGDVWQRQYHDRQLRSDDHLAMAIRYCALNPVRAGLVSEAGWYPHFWSRFDGTPE
jgi:putative transposase